MSARRRAAVTVMLAGGVALGVLACSGDEKSTSVVDGYEMQVDEAAGLLAEYGCTNCHAAPGGTAVPAVGGPPLDGVLERVRRPWLDGFLGDPAAARGRCPDMLHGLDAAARAEEAKLLGQELAARSPQTFVAVAETLDPTHWNPAAGEELFRRVGCAACHEDGFADRDLAAKTEWRALVALLQDPLAVRPHDLMPSSALTEREAGWIASWLLRARADELELVREPGLEVASYVFPQQPQTVDDLEGLAPVMRTVVPTIGVEPRAQDENFGLVYTGMLEVAESGSYELYVTSDDGSRVWLDDAMVIDNDGHHAPQRKSARLELQAGSHRLKVAMFEAGGGETLEVGFRVDGEDRPLGAAQLWHGSLQLPPSTWAAYTRDDAQAVGGAMALEARSCTACHRAAGEPARPTRRWNAADGGCLAAEPPADAPDYALPADLRGLLRAAVRTAVHIQEGRGHLGHERLPDRAASTAADRAEAAMRMLGCMHCHARRDLGGPSAAALAHFEGRDDLGDEGARPPDLTGVGAKLTEEALAAVLAGELRARPYMQTRMPVYASARTAALAADLAAADAGAFGDHALAAADATADQAASAIADAVAAAIEAGRHLAGTEGFACVSCHPVAGHPGPGIQGMDLAVMTGRLRPEWFRAWVLDPPALRPGTRMPAFFPGGKSVHADVLGGDADAQVAALWSYLALGTSMPLPKGLVVDPDAYALVPIERPLYVGVFMDGLSARTTAVGFPERVHAAFDLHHARLGLLWHGDFLDVAGTWDGRAGQLEKPPVEWLRTRALPPGPAFARPGSATEAWPKESGKEAGWRMRAHRRDAQGRPTWVYAQGELVVEESLQPHFAADGARVTRKFRVTNPGPLPVTMRAWAQSGFVDLGDGAWETTGGVTLRLQVRGAVARVRMDMPPDHDLLIDVPAGAHGFEFEVEMEW